MAPKVIIAGGRDFDDYDLLLKSLKHFNFEVVSGMAKGADALGVKLAKDFGLKLHCFPAKWSMGRQAGYLRNAQMAKFADALIAFWDGSSKGTGHMIKLAQDHGLKVKVVYYNNKKDLL